MDSRKEQDNSKLSRLNKDARKLYRKIYRKQRQLDGMEKDKYGKYIDGMKAFNLQNSIGDCELILSNINDMINEIEYTNDIYNQMYDAVL